MKIKFITNIFKKIIPKELKKNVFLRKFLAVAAALLFGFPEKKLIISGVTGTTGKTTVTFMIKSILEANNIKTGLIGTAGYYIDDEVTYPKEHTPNTTPDPFTLHYLLRKMVRKGLKAAVMEVSSFALMYERIYGINFKAAALTNISPNYHIAIHGSMDNYVFSKSKLFRYLKPGTIAVLPKESEYFDLFAKNTRARVLSYGFDNACDLWAEIKETAATNSRAVIHYNNNVFALNLPIPGSFNILNALAAIASVHQFSFPMEKIKKGLEELKTVPGRLEYINGRQPFSLIVDKANTPAAFCGVIDFIKILNPKKTIAVYGNSGKYPVKERERLAEIATGFFDLTIITEDDPEEASSQKSIDDFLNFVKKNNIPENKYLSFSDRKIAIREAMKRAGSGDLIVLLGRGNEQTMDYGTKVIPFDDRQVAREALKEQGYLP